MPKQWEDTNRHYGEAVGLRVEINKIRAQLAEKDKVIEGLKAEKTDLLERHRQNLTAFDAAISGPHEYWGHIASLLAVTSYDALYDYGVNERPSEQAVTLGNVLDDLRVELAKAKGVILKSGKVIDGLREAIAVFEFNTEHDPIYNLEGAISDLEGKIKDEVILQTLYRVQEQLGRCYHAALNAAPNTDGAQ